MEDCTNVFNAVVECIEQFVPYAPEYFSKFIAEFAATKRAKCIKFDCEKVFSFIECEDDFDWMDVGIEHVWMKMKKLDIF